MPALCPGKPLPSAGRGCGEKEALWHIRRAMQHARGLYPVDSSCLFSTGAGENCWESAGNGLGD